MLSGYGYTDHSLIIAQTATRNLAITRQPIVLLWCVLSYRPALPLRFFLAPCPAAARFGDDTKGDCLVNTWLGGRAEGYLDAAMAGYLSISIPPMQAGPYCCDIHDVAGRLS